MWESALWVDNRAHLLHFAERIFPCNRDIEAMQVWNGHALLLSSDTDCLSLWDADGLIRTARVGVYPQDMAVQGDTAYICGGADGMLHLLHLPDLHESAEHSLPGMPERVCIQGETAHVLTLLADAEVQTALLALDLSAGSYAEVLRFSGLPGCITADGAHLWIGVSEMVCRLPKGAATPDMVIEGIGLARQIDVQSGALTIFDELENRTVHLHTSAT